MFDIKMTRGFDIETTPENDIPIVTGVDAFHQAVALSTIRFFNEEVGDVDKESIPKLLEQHARSVARQFPDYIDRLYDISSEFRDEDKTTIDVELTYTNGEQFSFPVE